jgi:bifunctional non-homologous end joining protein LigD
MTTPVHRPEAFTGATTSSALDHADLEGARPAPLPRQPSPQLATATDTPPEGDGWLHEIKLDGYRLLARIEAGRVQLLTRNGHDWSDRLPRIAAALAGLPLAAGLVDGELVALGSGGLSVFRDLQRALADGDDSGLTYQVFDLLHADGLDLTGMSLRRRKAALSAVLVDAGLEPPVRDGPLRYTDHLQGSGPAFYRRACRLGLEGIIAKRADAGYRGGRNRHWLKIKCRRDQELVIGGWTEPGGARQGFGACARIATRPGSSCPTPPWPADPSRRGSPPPAGDR